MSLSTDTSGTAIDPCQIAADVDVRLVVSDLDGTLLDARGHIPDRLWPLLAKMKERGVVFAAASGRQYATLARQFAPVKDQMAFIAENGTLVVHAETELSVNPMDPAFVHRLIRHVRELNAQGLALGSILCGREAAYVDVSDPELLAQVSVFYELLEGVDDLLDVEDATLKFAVYDKGDAESGSGPLLRPFCAPNQVVVSTDHWLDIMAPGINKGVAVKTLQEALGVTRAQTVVFGDYLNDLEMMEAGDQSFAMANAHPEIIRRARYLAPSNKDLGVITTLEALLDA